MILLLLLFWSVVFAGDPGGDLVLFCGPGPGAGPRAFAPMAGILAREKERGARLLCLDPSGLEGVEAPGPELRNIAAPEAVLPGPLRGPSRPGGLPYLCANLVDPGGKNPFQAVREAGGVTLCGAVGPLFPVPPGWKVLPPGGVTPPPSADVLLFRGAEEDALEWARAVGARVVLLAGPFLRRDPVHAGPVTVVYVPLFARAAVRLTLRDGKPAAVEGSTLIVPRPGIPEELRRLFPEETLRLGPVHPPSPPAEVAPGLVLRPRFAEAHRGVKVEVESVRFTRSLGPARAERGFFAVCRAAWTDELPYAKAGDRLVPRAYRIDNLFDHAFLWVDGRHVVPPAPADNGHLGESPHVLLAGRGARAARRLVFRLPAAPRVSLDFLFLDEFRGRFLLPLWGKRPPPPDFRQGPAANAFLSFGVCGLEEGDRFQGVEAGEGRVLLRLELAGKSVLRGTVQGKECGFLVNYAPRGYVQLVEEDRFVYDPLPLETPYGFQGMEKFVPELVNEGTLVFRVPREHGALSLWVFMPARRSVRNGKVSEDRPPPLVVPLGPGKGGFVAAAPAEGDALRTITDGDVVKVILHPPEPAEEGEKGTVLPVEVVSLSPETEIFRPFEQILLWTADGGQRPPSKSGTAALDRGAPRYLRLPPRGRRVARLAYDARGVGVVYRGFSRADATPFPGVKPPSGGPPPAASSRARRPTPPGAAPVERKELPPPKALKAPGRPPAGLAGVGLDPEAVNRAIEKAADFLAAYLLEGGSGSAAYDYLYAYAVVHSRRFREDPELASWVIDFFTRTPAEGVYSTALRLMGLRALDPAARRKLIAECAAYLVACQDEEGLWSYGPPQVQDEPDAGRAGSGLTVIGGRPVKGCGTDVKPVTRKLPAVYDREWRYAGGGDFSCTQYAALGLKAAEESGVLVPREVWGRLARACAEAQAENGGWGYGSVASSGYGSMTAAAFSAYLVACHYAGIEPDRKVVEGGYAWLGKYFTLDENPGANGWIFYWLYSLERAGVLGGVEFFGAYEWYPLLAKKLLETQRPDGSWCSGASASPYLDTAFALLCLSRATVPLAQQPLEPGGGEGTLVTGFKGTGRAVYVILDASRSMRASFEGKTRFDWARDVVKRIVRRLPPRAAVGLRVFGARTRPNNPHADTDSVLLIPPVPGSGEAAAAILDRLRPSGRTPLALSLEGARKDLDARAPGREAVVVLVTDGEESDPRARPFDAARKLAARPRTDLLVMALAVEEKAAAFLQRLAEEGRGRCYRVDDAPGFDRALAEGLWKQAPFVVKDRFGKEVARGAIGDRVDLAEGKYEMEVQAGGRTFVRTLWINTGKRTLVLFEKPD